MILSCRYFVLVNEHLVKVAKSQKEFWSSSHVHKMNEITFINLIFNLNKQKSWPKQLLNSFTLSKWKENQYAIRNFATFIYFFWREIIRNCLIGFENVCLLQTQWGPNLSKVVFPTQQIWELSTILRVLFFKLLIQDCWNCKDFICKVLFEVLTIFLSAVW